MVDKKEDFCYTVAIIFVEGGVDRMFGETIRQYRLDKGMSQGDLANALDVSRQSVSKWENDLAVPELDKLIKMANVFGVTLDELVRREAPCLNPPEPENVSAPLTETKKTVSQGQRITGTILLCTGAVVLLLLTLLGGFISGLLFSCPFVLCGLVCLFCQTRAGLWCGWAAYFAVDNYFHYATGVNRMMVFQPYFYTMELDVTFLLSWIMFLLCVGLIVLTLVSFRKQNFSGIKRKIHLLCCFIGGIFALLGISYGVGALLNYVIRSQGGTVFLVRIISWGMFLLDWGRLGLFTAALVLGVSILRERKKHNP